MGRFFCLENIPGIPGMVWSTRSRGNWDTKSIAATLRVMVLVSEPGPACHDSPRLRTFMPLAGF